MKIRTVKKRGIGVPDASGPPPCPVCAARADEQTQKRATTFAPYDLARTWAEQAGLLDDDGVIVRPTHYRDHEPVPAQEVRGLLAAYAAAQGWPTDHPVGRLDVLEAAARDLLAHFYRVQRAEPVVDPLGPPPQWATRGDQDALPPWWERGSVAEVFVAEHCYSDQGRVLAIISGTLEYWTGSGWARWGTFSPTSVVTTSDAGTVEVIGLNLADTVADWLRVQRYWDGDRLVPVENTGGVLEHVEQLLTWPPGLNPPTGPADLAALDHQRARPAAPAVRNTDQEREPIHPGDRGLYRTTTTTEGIR